MGNQLAPSVGLQGFQDLPSYLHDISDYVFHRCVGTESWHPCMLVWMTVTRWCNACSTLGGGKVMKTMRCVHDYGAVVVKFYIKRSPEFSLSKYTQKLEEIRRKFSLEHTKQPGTPIRMSIADHPGVAPVEYFSYAFDQVY